MTKLSPSLIESVAAAVRDHGEFPHRALARFGVPSSTAKWWVREGLEALSGGEEADPGSDKDLRMRLAAAVDMAEAQCQHQWLVAISTELERAALNGKSASAAAVRITMFERRFAIDWRKRDAEPVDGGKSLAAHMRAHSASQTRGVIPDE